MNLDAELLLIIDECGGLLQVGVVKHIEELAKSGECALALEELCNYLGENPQHRPSDLLARIASLGAILKVDPSYWQPLTAAPTTKTLNAKIRSSNLCRGRSLEPR